MKQRILQNRLVLLESIVIFVLGVILLLGGIKYKQSISSMCKISTSAFENNKIINIESRLSNSNSFIYFWVNKNKEIKNIGFRDGKYAIRGESDEDDVLYSTIDYPGFNETSYIIPTEERGVSKRNIEDIYVYKLFTLESGKVIEFIIDNKGNSYIFEK